MRPQNHDFQANSTWFKKNIRRMVEANRSSSMILYGPPDRSESTEVTAGNFTSALPGTLMRSRQ